MGLFDRFKKQELSAVNISDNEICAIADGKMIALEEVNDPVFAQKMMGDGVAFQYESDKATLCAPANGTLSVLFPTGHAFGVTMNNGVELLVHCGIDTVEAKGKGFKVLSKQGASVKAGDPIVEVDFSTLRKQYDMTTMLIITNNKTVEFNKQSSVQRGNVIAEAA